MTAIYTAHATSIAGRNGRVETDDQKLSLRLTNPDNGEGTNPEQLFACGYSACFGSTVVSIANLKKLELPEIKIKAAVSLNKDEIKGYFLSAELDTELKNIETKIAEEVIKQAHQICPYSRATRNNINVSLKLNGHPLK